MPLDMLLLRNVLAKIAAQDVGQGTAPVGFAASDHTHEGGGTHPGLASHDALGLATDAELAAHSHPSHAHPYAADDHSHQGGAHPDLATHTGLGLAAAHAHPYASDAHGHDTSHNHDAAYAPVHAHPYAADSHAHAHPDLSAHDSLGLATQAELQATIHSHPYSADVHTHPYAADSHTHAYAPVAHSHAGSGINPLRTTSNQVINAGAGVFTDITGLTFPVVAGTDYAFTLYIVFRSAQLTTGWRAGINHPGGTVDFWAGSPTVANGAAGVATHTERHNTVVNDMTLLTATVQAATDLAVRIEGRYLCTANGTFAARFANELAANTDIVVQKGSWGWYF